EGGRKDQPPPYMLERAPNSGDYLLASRPDRLMGEKDPLYAWLSKLRSRRQLGEARRLFYVAVTRARDKLVMSGLARKKGNSFSTSAQNPLGWLSKHYGIDELCAIDRITCPEEAESDATGEWKRSASGADGFFVQIEPDYGACEAHPLESSRPELAPADFEREKPVFTVISPSRLRALGGAHYENRQDPGSGASAACAPAACPPDVWGTLVHRLLAHFGKKGVLPSAQSASASLTRIGIESSKSLEIARNALSEVKSCLADPWLQAFYGIPPERRRIEWSAESAHERDVLYSGVIDLAAEFEGKWKLVDFKTSRPLEGECTENFLQRETEAHRPQILGYCEIWANLTGTDPALIDAFIFWTAIRQWSVVGGR
ncbi:MAG: PD-(D/E)XK nuclease family protein, partial [Syntrophobacteraceae bacterium]